MPSFEDILREEYEQLDDPAYIQSLISKRVETARPEFESVLGGIDARLSRQGMFSTSPVTAARYGAASDFQRGITSDVYGETERRKTGLEALLAQLEQMRLKRKMMGRAGLFKFLGTGIGAAAGFMIGGPPGAVAGAGVGGSFGGYDTDPDMLEWASERGLDFTRYEGGGG